MRHLHFLALKTGKQEEMSGIFDGIYSITIILLLI